MARGAKFCLAIHLMIDFVPAPATLPPGQRVYAIGDIHGCLDRLAAVHEQIAEDLGSRPVDESILVHLGDYVDRGPNSRGVVDLLRAAQAREPDVFICLKGNHEEMMVDGCSGRTDDFVFWTDNGGDATMMSVIEFTGQEEQTKAKKPRKRSAAKKDGAATERPRRAAAAG